MATDLVEGKSTLGDEAAHEALARAEPVSGLVDAEKSVHATDGGSVTSRIASRIGVNTRDVQDLGRPGLRPGSAQRPGTSRVRTGVRAARTCVGNMVPTAKSGDGGPAGNPIVLAAWALAAVHDDSSAALLSRCLRPWLTAQRGRAWRGHGRPRGGR